MLIKIESVLKKVVFIALVLYMLDIILLGSRGMALTQNGSISTRIFFFGIAIIMSTPGLIRGFHHYIRNKYIISVIVFMILLVSAFALGIVNGNNYNILAQDFKGFLNILIVLPMIYALDDEEKTLLFIKVMVFVLFVMAVVVLVLSFHAQMPDVIAKPIYRFVETNKIGSLIFLTENVTRVFFYTASRLFMVAFLFLLAYMVMDSEKKWYRKLMLVGFICACFLSYTRSIYLAIFVCFIAFVVIVCLKFKKYLTAYMRNIARTALLTVVIVLTLGVLQNSNLISISIYRCLLSIQDSEESVIGDDIGVDEQLNNQEAEMLNISVREQRTQLALSNFKKSPIWGNGLGVENDVEGNPIEYFHLDLLSKMGIIGYLAFLFPFLVGVYDLFSRKKKYSEQQALLLLAGVVSVLFMLIISYFNPCMNTSTGLMVYGLMMAIGSLRTEQSVKERK